MDFFKHGSCLNINAEIIDTDFLNSFYMYIYYTADWEDLILFNEF